MYALRPIQVNLSCTIPGKQIQSHLDVLPPSHLVLNLLLLISVLSYVVFLNRNSQLVHGLFLSAFSPSVLPTHLKFLQGKFNSNSQCGGNRRLQKMYCKNWKQFQRSSLTWTLVRIFTEWFRLVIRSSPPWENVTNYVHDAINNTSQIFQDARVS